tara:strand:- start:107 stop:688 length:582 start_codon:yes stop_codon:yes gene_type:complete
MDSDYYYEIKSQLDEITLGELAEMYGPDTKIIPFIQGLLKSKNDVDDDGVEITIPIDIIQEIKKELDKKSQSEQHPEFYPRVKQEENKDKKSAMVLLMKKMFEKLNENNNLKKLKLDEEEKYKICLQCFSDFKEDINHNNIFNIFKVEEGNTNQIEALSEKIITQEAVQKIINKRKKGGTLKKRNRKKKSRNK